jgi:hypothetical protein
VMGPKLDSLLVATAALKSSWGEKFGI